MNKQADETITAIGALAEVCAEMYRQLIKNGFKQKDAFELVKEYIRTSFEPKK